MAQDFGKPYSGIQYFSGLWDDVTADTLGKRDAMAVLADAVPLCGEEDQRQRREVRDAFAYLERHSGCTARLSAFAGHWTPKTLRPPDCRHDRLQRPGGHHGAAVKDFDPDAWQITVQGVRVRIDYYGLHYYRVSPPFWPEQDREGIARPNRNAEALAVYFRFAARAYV